MIHHANSILTIETQFKHHNTTDKPNKIKKIGQRSIRRMAGHPQLPGSS